MTTDPTRPHGLRPPPPTRKRKPVAARPGRVVEQRGLDPGPAPLATIAIRSPGQHPFIYRKMIEGPVGEPIPAPGDLVRVVSREGEPRGFGLWNPRSQIALRLLTRQSDTPGVEFWNAALAKSVALRTQLLKLDTQTDAYRLVHAESDGLSGLIVDRIADVLSIECFSLGIYQRIEALAGLLATHTPTKHFRVHVDERVAAAEDMLPRPLASLGVPPAVTIREHGVRYRVRFEGGHKTGFFCDQRENRRMLAELCAGKDVLDVCCYTGGFGLNAKLHGGANEVTCVDLDEKSLALARENANLNQTRLSFVHSDAFGYLRQMGLNQRRYGALVLDPPKLITSREEISLGKRKYFDLNVLAMSLVEADGLLLTCSCSGLLSTGDFLALLRAAARQAGRSARVLRVTGAAPDHPVALDVIETEYLKAVWLVMGD
jgi:23S rRNA (cytosine1962-C5)-methyltransferase